MFVSKYPFSSCSLFVLRSRLLDVPQTLTTFMPFLIQRGSTSAEVKCIMHLSLLENYTTITLSPMCI